jgi:GT2 family glycosyltransferase
MLVILKTKPKLRTSCQQLHLLQLSIIIVNYNVKHFLEQCLCSVIKAIRGMDAEIIVVDNHSSDNSVEYLSPKFSNVRFISNDDNIGFGKACNQGRKFASGRVLLFLNPDTIVPEDCFQHCIAFLDSHADAGALGIRMVDGSGKFLPESKRAFPSPATSLYKLFGLARLFPRSRVFAKYHLGQLDPKQTNRVDVLAGAFMMIRKDVMDKVGGFDESFFMYGEDVDLSYRIQKSNYNNYYFAGSTIIHFKGESTRKGSMNYVRMFYTAMSTFVRKHYGGGRAGLFNFLIHAAIWFRALLTACANFIRRVGLPLIDAGLILLSFWLVKEGWSRYVKTGTNYQNQLLWIAFPAFTVFYLTTAYYAGLYDRWYKRSELIRSTLIATVVLLAGYALLPEKYRFSRAIILFGALLAFVMISLLRGLLIRTGVLNSHSVKEENFNTIIAGSPAEYQEAIILLQGASMHNKVLGRVVVNGPDSGSIGSLKDIKKISSVVPYREIIFCEGSLSFSDIIGMIGEVPEKKGIKIHAAGSNSIVGSESSDISGEAVSGENGLKLANPYNRRLKRLIDLSFSIFVLILFPIQFFIVRKPFSLLGRAVSTLIAIRTWIGYATEEKKLPKLRGGIMACNGIPLSQNQPLPTESLQMMDYWYARDYDPMQDLRILFRIYRRLGD